MKSNDIKELHKWLKNLLKEKYINKADIKQILNDFDFEAQQQVKVEPEVKTEIAEVINNFIKTREESLYKNPATALEESMNVIIGIEINAIEELKAIIKKQFSV